MNFKDYLNELKTHTPYDFSDYSDNSIHRRIQKILKDQNLTLEQLYEKTTEDHYFVEHLVEEITVNTTEFFRDPEIWVTLYDKIYPTLKRKNTINIWHAGCSSGQELYSNMILLNELGLLDRAKILATDINNKMIKTTKDGGYRYKFNLPNLEAFNKTLTKKPINGISKLDLNKYFNIDLEDDYIEVKDFLRDIPEVKKHDLVKEPIPAMHKFDIIFCRNVLIYFNTNLQSKIFQLFYDQLNNAGNLILGNHEGITGFFKTKFVKNGPTYVKNKVFHFKY